MRELQRLIHGLIVARHAMTAAFLAAWIVAPAEARESTVRVDARSAPWRTGINRKLAFGLADAMPPTIVLLGNGVKLRISASGQTSTVTGGGTFGPDGDRSWPMDRGVALFPSHYMQAHGVSIYLNELVGAFINADGLVVGKPFPIGSGVEVNIPDGAAALSLGMNDDRYSDNAGFLSVHVVQPEPKVIVEQNDAQN